MSTTHIEQLYPQIAELALHSNDLRTFRQAWMALAAPHFPADSFDICSTSDGRNYATYTFNADPGPVEQGAPSHLAEMTSSELRVVMCGRAIVDHEVFSARRRSSLRAYQEVLTPRGVVHNAIRGWARGGTVSFLFLCSHRASRSFEARPLRAIDDLVPIISAGEALLHARSKEMSPRRTALDLGLTQRESLVVDLAQRGLTNHEIARLTGLAIHTVRNRLSSIYRKLGVANRTELALVVSGFEGPTVELRSRCAVSQFIQNERAALRWRSAI